MAFSHWRLWVVKLLASKSSANKEIARSNASAFLAFSMAASNLSDRTRPWLTCMLFFLYVRFLGSKSKEIPPQKKNMKQWISEFQKTGLISIKEFIWIQFSESQDFNPNKKIHFNHCRRQFCEGDLFGMVSSRDPFKRRIVTSNWLGNKMVTNCIIWLLIFLEDSKNQGSKKTRIRGSEGSKIQWSPWERNFLRHGWFKYLVSSPPPRMHVAKKGLGLGFPTKNIIILVVTIASWGGG